MECTLHVASNSDLQKSQARGDDEQIQQFLRNNFNLTVDVVKQGAGTTNTENIVRSFFEKRKEVSKIIGVDEDLLTRLYVVLQIISCTREILKILPRKC